LISLARPRHGHFDLATGNHGDVWLDLDGLFLHPEVLRPHVAELARLLRAHQVDAVCGPVEGGAFLAQAVATVLGVAFLPAYRAPSGGGAALGGYRLPHVPGGIQAWKVAIADDAVNAGTAVRACFALLDERAASVAAVASLISLGSARQSWTQASATVPFYAIETMPARVWPASRCPLCASDVPLEC
jgi:orotate phosphoribosyltransferase